MECWIGTRKFKTKDAAAREVRRILNSAELHIPLTGDDLNLISSLYELHPRRRQDVKPESFCVGINSFHGTLTRGFHAIFPDGTRDQFSYRTCLTPTTAAPSLIGALRAAIMASQRQALHDYYRGRPVLACWRCKQPTPIETAHVHHLYPKFRDIADHFVSLIGLPKVEAEVIGDAIADNVIQSRWQHFHDSVAQRVVSCPKCNAQAEREDRNSET